MENSEEFDFFEGKVFVYSEKLSLIDAALFLVNNAKFDKGKDMKVILQEAFDYLKELLPYDISIDPTVADMEFDMIGRFFKNSEEIKRENWNKSFSSHNVPNVNLEKFFDTGIMTEELMNDIKSILKMDNSGEGKGDVIFATFVFDNTVLTKLSSETMFEKIVFEDFFPL